MPAASATTAMFPISLFPTRAHEQLLVQRYQLEPPIPMLWLCGCSPSGIWHPRRRGVSRIFQTRSLRPRCACRGSVSQRRVLPAC